MRDKWFSPATVLICTANRYYDEDGVTAYFFDGDYRINLHRSLRSCVDNSPAPICGEHDDEFDWTCLLPPGHETKHLPCLPDLNRNLVVTSMSVRSAPLQQGEGT